MLMPRYADYLSLMPMRDADAAAIIFQDAIELFSADADFRCLITLLMRDYAIFADAMPLRLRFRCRCRGAADAAIDYAAVIFICAMFIRLITLAAFAADIFFLLYAPLFSRIADAAARAAIDGDDADAFVTPRLRDADCRHAAAFADAIEADISHAITPCFLPC